MLSSNLKHAKKSFWIGLAIQLVVFLIPFFAPSLVMDVPFGFVEDDAFFYLETARNFVRYHWSTFDGIHFTNGYHLLNEFILVTLYQFGDFLGLHSKYIFLGICGMGFTASFLLAQLCTHGSWIWALAVWGLLLSGGILMETVFLGMFLILLMRASVSEVPNLKTLFIVGLFTPLLRIDASIILIVPILVMLLRRKRPAAATTLIGLITGCALHFSLMHLLFDNFFSVSSVIKAGAGGNTDLMRILNNLGVQPIWDLGRLARALLLLVLFIASIWLELKNRPRFSAITVSLIVGLFLWSLIHIAFGTLRSWYLIPGYAVSLSLIFAHGYIQSFWGLRAVRLLLASFGLAYCFFKINVFISQRDWRYEFRNFIKNIALQVPESEPIYQYDLSGVTAYFSERSVVNGDGLMNDYAYAQRIKQQRIGNYLEEANICYLITNQKYPVGTAFQLYDLKILEADVSELARTSSTFRQYTAFRLLKLTSERCKFR